MYEPALVKERAYEEQPVHGGGSSSRMMSGGRGAAASLALVHFSLFVRTVSSLRPLPVTSLM